jgi:RNA polymerase sigma factor (sigma-70 family)
VVRCHIGRDRYVILVTDPTKRDEEVTVSDEDLLAERFEEHRTRLTAMAYRMLGSTGPADDAVQEAWIRLSRSEAENIENLGGWLTTVVTRVCLDMLRARTARREELVDIAHPAVTQEDSGHPEHEAVLADAVSDALLVVLSTLAPAERLAFVLHDLFAMPFEEIARILGRTSTATRQLASRARRRVQSPERTLEADRTVQGRVVDAFLTASRTGDLEELVWLLHPDAVLRADGAAVGIGAVPQTTGARAVAETFAGRAQAARPATLDGFPAAVWTVRGRPKVVFGFTVVDGRIAEIELLADPEVLATLDVVAGSAAS